jgi:hypothetical protein
MRRSKIVPISIGDKLSGGLYSTVIGSPLSSLGIIGSGLNLQVRLFMRLIIPIRKTINNKKLIKKLKTEIILAVFNF